MEITPLTAFIITLTAHTLRQYWEPLYFGTRRLLNDKAYVPTYGRMIKSDWLVKDMVYTLIPVHVIYV